MKIKVVGLILLAAALVYYFYWREEPSTPIFDEVTVQSGISYTGITYGSAWADIDVDGRPDLYLTNHLNDARLYRNLGGGRFQDVTGQYFHDSQIGGDKHGAAWADFNNDGRQELAQLTGAMRGVGAEANRLYVHNGARFEDVSEELGVSNPLARARMPLWVDFDNDGYLDLFQGAVPRLDSQAAPFLFLQRNGRFVDGGDHLGRYSKNIPFCILTDLDGDTRADLFCRASGKNQTAIVYNLATGTLNTSLALPASAFEDAVAGDFDNDGRIDVFLARRNPPADIAYGQARINELMVDFRLDEANLTKSQGIRFVTPGDISVSVESVWPHDWLAAKDIFLGQRGVHPAGLEFAVSRESASATGLVSFVPGQRKGVFLGRVGLQDWSVHVSGDLRELDRHPPRYQQIAIKLTSTDAISKVKLANLAESSEAAVSRLLMNREGKLQDESRAAGLEDLPIAAVSVVAGDFDNDMKLDLFLVGSNVMGKTGNVLLLNRGMGRFSIVRNAGGASGSKVGVGDSVTTADIDGDGFLDLLVASGGSMGRSESLLASKVGSYQLYRNLGNGNHWLQIDLVGKKSNRDGIGARVELTVAGVRQTRIQDGGVHNSGQNFSRLHFGLEKNSSADSIVVHWPSGIRQELRDVPANRIIRIEERN
jgi:hypothetical protein